jgi:acyl-CoA reductase-like NAD-dependent aldehyde dehydrogenase
MINRGLNIGGNEFFKSDFLPVLNPANGDQVGSYICAKRADVDLAVDTAYSSQKSWARVSNEAKSEILIKTANLIQENCDQIAEILTMEQGKTLSDSRKEINFGAEVFRYYGDLVSKNTSEKRESSNPDFSSIVSHRPLGVIGAIVPWNYPVDLWCWKVAPALAAGNGIVVKPPIETPLAAGSIANLLYEAGLPEGLLSDIPGGIEVGQHLVSHPRVNAITATCSTETGKSIMSSAAPSLKRLLLELGGNCPLIVLEDADIEITARAALRRSFSNMGQICIAVNRIIVTEKVAHAFTETLIGLVKEMKIGNGMDPDVEYGPTTTQAVITKSESHIMDALHRGGRLLAGGERLTDGQFSNGNFFSPTVIDRVHPNSKLAHEETFGPVVGIFTAKNSLEAIAIANDSQFGLAAYVFGGDLEKATEVANQLEVGGVGVNVNDVTELDAPFGGWKMSGIGRELGREGFLEMTQTQHVRVKKYI